MSSKAVLWTLLAVIALAAVLLFNYWAAYQPLSTLVYAGLVLAVFGLANLVVPFRFLGVRKRRAGAALLAGGLVLSFAALWWPASPMRVAQPKTRLDEIMPEYQFSERHSARVHASPEQAIQAARQSTFRDMRSLITLLKVRAGVLRAPSGDFDKWLDRPVLDAFAASGYLLGGNEHEVVAFGVVNPRASRRPEVRSAQEFVDYREPGAIKMAYAFHAEPEGNGWARIVAETRVGTRDEPGFARYWRVIVPGSGLLRLQWLDGIRKRAESMSGARS